MTAAMAPPAERPVTKTRLGSSPWSATVRSTIALIEAASPRLGASVRVAGPARGSARHGPGWLLPMRGGNADMAPLLTCRARAARRTSLRLAAGGAGASDREGEPAVV